MKRILYYLNPKNVSLEIAGYGYTYTIWNTVVAYLCTAMIMVFFSRILSVHTTGILVCVAFSMIILPYVLVLSYKGMYEQKKFSEVCQYIEHTLYAFQKSNRIVEALETVWTILPEDSRIRELVAETIEYIMYDTKDEAVITNGLRKIENQYHSDRIKAVHAMMMRIEQSGGDSSVSVSILQKDRSLWQKQTVIHQKQCAVWKRNTVIGIILSMIMCSITPLVLKRNGSNIDITNGKIYQVSAVIMVIVSILIYVRITMKTTVNWVEKDDEISIEEAERLYQRVVKGKKDLGQRVALRKLKKEIIKAFPSWLLDVCIHLQTNNVHMSISNSYENAPVSLKPAIGDLLDNLSVAPEEVWPYQKFLQEFEIPEVGAAMGMLFSISSGTGHDAGHQLEEILNRNSEIIAAAEEIRNQDKLGGMYGVFLMPTMAGAGKMLVDMTLILFSFLNYT